MIRTTPSNAPRRLLLMLLIGLLLRLVLWFWFGDVEPGIVDERHYDAIATNLLERSEFALEPGVSTTARPPLYPALLASVYGLFGSHHYQAVRLLQIVLNVAIAGVVFLLARRIYDSQAALWSAALTVLYPSLWGFDYLLLTEISFTLLLVLGILFAARWSEDGDARAAALAGLFLGLGALTRSVLQLALPVVALLALWHHATPRRRRRSMAAFLLASGLIVLPWIVRNSLLEGRLVPVDSMALRTVVQGNVEFQVTQRGGKVLWTTPEVHSGSLDTESAATAAPPRPLLETARFVARRPLLAMEHLGIKALQFWQLDRNLAAAARRGQLGPIPRPIVLLLAAACAGFFAVTFLMAIVGAIVRPPQPVQRRLLLALPAVVWAAHTLSIPHTRYHVPLMPLLFVFAGAVLAEPRRPLDPAVRRKLRMALIVCVAVAATWAVHVVLVDYPDLTGV